MNLRNDHAQWYVQDLESKGYKVDGPMDITLTGHRLAVVRNSQRHILAASRANYRVCL